MRGLLLVLAALALAGCKPAQVTLALDPGFYPSAVAYDPVNDRFLVASYATGAVAAVRQDGTVASTLRSERASGPVVQIAYEARVRRLWVLTPKEIEALDLAALPVRRTTILDAGGSARFADIVAEGNGRAYILEGATGEILQADASRRVARVFARLPDAGDPAPSLAGGALVVVPGGAALLAARGGALWRIDLATAAIEPIPIAAPLVEVSQLVVIGSDAAAHHVAVFRGRANEIVTLHLSPDARRAVVDAGTRMRFDTPLHGAFDGRQVVVLLGRLRHHPGLGGDGRPNLPPRLATYFPGGANSARLAAAPPSAGPALVR